jgi:hypothetical protein
MNLPLVDTCLLWDVDEPFDSLRRADVVGEPSPAAEERRTICRLVEIGLNAKREKP